jgi:hypothetical protein
VTSDAWIYRGNPRSCKIIQEIQALDPRLGSQVGESEMKKKTKGRRRKRRKK